MRERSGARARISFALVQTECGRGVEPERALVSHQSKLDAGEVWSQSAHLSCISADVMRERAGAIARISFALDKT